IMEYAEKEGETCYDAYKNSSYKDSDFLSWFLVADRLPASMAVGLIERIRLEEEAAEDSDADEHRRYKDFTEILEKGYRNLKNQLKKAEYIDGSMFQKIVQDSNDMVHAASEMMVLLVIAEELEIPVHEDYDFYLGLQILESYEEDLETLPEPEITQKTEAEDCTEICRRVIRGWNPIIPAIIWMGQKQRELCLIPGQYLNIFI
ncbi:MAG: hypothetical protein ACLTAF_15455, partial [Blautia coccoides]